MSATITQHTMLELTAVGRDGCWGLVGMMLAGATMLGILGMLGMLGMLAGATMLGMLGMLGRPGTAGCRLAVLRKGSWRPTDPAGMRA